MRKGGQRLGSLLCGADTLVRGLRIYSDFSRTRVFAPHVRLIAQVGLFRRAR